MERAESVLTYICISFICIGTRPVSGSFSINWCRNLALLLYPLVKMKTISLEDPTFPVFLLIKYATFEETTI